MKDAAIKEEDPGEARTHPEAKAGKGHLMPEGQGALGKAAPPATVSVFSPGRGGPAAAEALWKDHWRQNGFILSTVTFVAFRLQITACRGQSMLLGFRETGTAHPHTEPREPW